MAAGGGSRILILEDDTDLAEVVCLALEASGHSVNAVTSGLDALLELARDQYSLALLDLDVPDLTGLGVLRGLRDFSAVETIVMSGRTGPWRREAVEVGASACLCKPVSLDTLLLMVERLGRARESSLPWPDDVLQLTPEDLSRVQALSHEELDDLPFGAIRVDRDGMITGYNRYEGTSVGRDAESVLGMRLSELAPCLMVKEFLDAIQRGFRERRLDDVLRFVFPFRGGWRAVNLRLYFDAAHESLWVFVAQRRRSRPEEEHPSECGRHARGSGDEVSRRSPAETRATGSER